MESGVRGRWADYIVDSVNLLNERLNPGERFFCFVEIDVAQQVIGGHKVWDMYGWVIEDSQRAEFEPLWLANVDHHAAPDGSTLLDKFCDVTVIWEDRGGVPYAKITHFGSFDEEPEVIPYDWPRLEKRPTRPSARAAFLMAWQSNGHVIDRRPAKLLSSVQMSWSGRLSPSTSLPRLHDLGPGRQRAR